MIRSVDPDALEVEITQVRATGDKLMADKGINLPDSQLSLPALTYKDIARGLFLSENTVKYHVKNIYSKVNVRNKIELMNLFTQKMA